MELEIGKQYSVVVTKVLDRGIVVQIEDTPETSFIHISKLSDRFISNISDIFSVGDKHTAMCVHNARQNKPELSIRDASIRTVDIQNRTNARKSLDEMIQDADNALKDKQRSKHEQPSRRRRRAHDKCRTTYDDI